MSNYTQTVIDYFADKAERYDLADEQPYWRLSDELLWTLLEERVLPTIPQSGRMLDAGGGTGRWTDRILRARPDLQCTLFDLSPEMTQVARAKAEANGYSDRLTIVIGDLDVVDRALEGEKFDLVTSFHNVLGFVRDPADTVRQLATLLRPGGALALFVPNLYHAVYFNIAVGNVEEARATLSDARGRFTDSMPAMHMFTPKGLRDLAAAAGLETEAVLGTPSTIYPGYAETQLEGSTGSLRDLLTVDETYAAVLEIERKLVGLEELAERGNNLFYLGHRGA